MHKAPVFAAATALAASGLAAQAQAQTATEERLEELERKVDVLAEEVKDKPERDRAGGHGHDSYGGVSHAASGIYQQSQGVSFGGYGNTFFQSSSAGTDVAMPLRQILYVGYRYNDWLVFNSEIEFETEVEQEDGETEREHEAEMEFAYLDFLLSEQANVRAGLMLLPLGIINQTHEPNTFFGNKRPIVETTLLPTTMRENGVGVYGRFAGGSLEYSAYVMNSWDAEGLSGEGLDHGVKQDGAALANDLAITGSLDWHPVPGATVGVAGWRGNMGQDRTFDGKKPDVAMTLWDVHAEYKAGGLWLRGLYSQASIDDTLAVSQEVTTGGGNPVGDGEAIPETMTGWYVEAGYDIMPLVGGPAEQKLYPWARYSSLDTQASLAGDVKSAGFTADPANDRTVTAVGLHYMPHPQVAVKAEVRDFSSEAEAEEANNQKEYLVGIGYSF